MGGAIARAFASHGATVHVTGRTRSKLDAVVRDIDVSGGTAIIADISFNALGVNVVQNKPMVELSVEEFVRPVAEAARTQFVTGTAVARRMIGQRSGVIMMLSSSAARESGFEMGGFGLACAAVEGFTRCLAGEVGRQGVRVVALRPNFTPETFPGPVDLDSPDMQALIVRTALGQASCLVRSGRDSCVRRFRSRGCDDGSRGEPHLRRHRRLTEAWRARRQPGFAAPVQDSTVRPPIASRTLVWRAISELRPV